MCCLQAWVIAAIDFTLLHHGGNLCCWLFLQGVSSHPLEESAIQMAYFQADGIPKELRVWRGRLETIPSATMLAMQADESGFDFEPDTASFEEQSQQALA